MASFLEGTLAKALDRGFKGTSLVGQVYRRVVLPEFGIDEYGKPRARQGNIWDCRGFLSRWKDSFRNPGVRADTQVNIFAASLPDGIEPLKDDMVQFRGDWYQLSQVRVDPALALWICPATVATIPTDLTSDEDINEDLNMAIVNNPRPTFKVAMIEDQAVPANTATVVAFDTVRNDIQSGFSTVAHNYAVPADGIYMFSSQVIVNSAEDSTLIWIKLYKNGVACSETESPWHNDWENGRLVVKFTTQQQCIEDDVIDVRIYATAAGLTAEGGTCEFNGAFVGASA